MDPESGAGIEEAAAGAKEGLGAEEVEAVAAGLVEEGSERGEVVEGEAELLLPTKDFVLSAVEAVLGTEEQPRGRSPELFCSGVEGSTECLFRADRNSSMATRDERGLLNWEAGPLASCREGCECAAAEGEAWREARRAAEEGEGDEANMIFSFSLFLHSFFIPFFVSFLTRMFAARHRPLKGQTAGTWGLQWSGEKWRTATSSADQERRKRDEISSRGKERRKGKRREERWSWKGNRETPKGKMIQNLE